MACALLMVAGVFVTVRGAAPSGAIFTTVADGSEVNYNIYQAKEDVYPHGGPGPGAPQHAAGLDDGVCVFQVTDPSGKTVLGTDPAVCRLFTVEGGVITSTAGNFLDGRSITWIDTLGASNIKWSYEDLAIDVHHEAHVESVEDGVHSIVIANQAGCIVGDVLVEGCAKERAVRRP